MISSCILPHVFVQKKFLLEVWNWGLSTIPVQRCCWASSGHSPAAPSWWWGLCSFGPGDCDTAWSAPGKTWVLCNCTVARWPGTLWTCHWHSCGHMPWTYWPTLSLVAAWIVFQRDGWSHVKKKICATLVLNFIFRVSGQHFKLHFNHIGISFVLGFVHMYRPKYYYFTHFNIFYFLEKPEADWLQRLLWPLMEPVNGCAIHYCRELPAAIPEFITNWWETQSHL